MLCKHSKQAEISERGIGANTTKTICGLHTTRVNYIYFVIYFVIWESDIKTLKPILIVYKMLQLLKYAFQIYSSFSLFFSLLSFSYHSVLYIQMSHPENQKGNRGTARAETGRQEIRQHIRDSATSE